MKTYFKYGSILTCFIIAFFLFRGCGKEKTKYVDKVTVKIDTVYKEVIADSAYILHVEKVIEWKTKTEYKTDTLEVFDIEHVDSLAILKDYLATRIYSDTIRPQRLDGYIVVRDSITQNRVVGRSLKERFLIPEITKTITITKPPRTTLYLGTELNGNKEYPMYSIGANAGLLLKSGKYLGVQYSLTKDGNPLYGIRFMLPVKTRK